MLEARRVGGAPGSRVWCQRQSGLALAAGARSRPLLHGRCQPDPSTGRVRGGAGDSIDAGASPSRREYHGRDGGAAIDGNLYSIPDDEWPDDRPVLPDDWFTLDEVLGTTVRSFLHEYDFGDGWQHDVTVQAVELADEERNGWPICLAGANACQPEDVGRLGGYAEFLEAIDNPAYDGHAATWRWAGGPFDPRGFDINSANRAMRDWLSESR